MIQSLLGPIRLAVLLLLSLATFADSLRFSYVQREVVLERLHSCPAKDIDRERRLQTYFAQAGCSDKALTLDQPKHSALGNVVCTLAGASEQQIVVGAHFDHAELGSGAVDNWSGASLLPSLYQAVATAPRKHTFVFLGFYGEEQGLVGSEHYVRAAGKEKLAQVDAMVNLDTLGLGPTNAWVSHADPNLAKLAFGLANALKVPLSGVNVENVGSTDSESFRDKKVPSIAFSSITQDTLPILHTIKDQLSQIKEDDYYDSYKFLSGYLVYLDNAVAARAAGASAGF
ncbi:MAG TPA: M28 family peptidase [Terriglobales bacterium]|nr:M28 family peptidase [Terriglobales bacterium]